MKRKILLGLTVMLCCFFAGGFYILLSISSATSKLENLLTFHEVEHLREGLYNKVVAVQVDLQQQDVTPAIHYNDFVRAGEDIEATVAQCNDCHHDPELQQQLEQLQVETDSYLKKLSRSITLRANSARLQEVKADAYDQGQTILDRVLQLANVSADRLAERTRETRAQIVRTRQVVTALVILGPLAVLAIAMFFLQRFSGSVTTLTRAAEELGKGRLDYRINEPLKDEFAILAQAFNSMAQSLGQEKQYTESVQRLYRALFESAQDAICIIESRADGVGQILSVNQAAAELYGYSIDEMQAMNCVELSPPAEHAAFRARIQQVLQGESFRSITTRCRRDGSCFPAEISAGPMVIDNHTYVLTFTRDITEREQTKKELLHANQMALVGQMAVGLAHEIKNPLAGIKATIEVLSSDLELEAEDKELFGRMIAEVDRMERLLRNLLKYARPQPPELDQVDLNSVVTYTIDNVKVTAARSAPAPIRFTCHLAAELPQVEVDSLQLQQVFLNLYLNAIEALADGGEITTRTSWDDTENCVRIDIEDSGPGMSEGTLKNLFQPFFTTKNKGTGLGLAICRRLVEQNRGTITAMSAGPGTGSCFTILLPPCNQPPEGD